MYDYYFMFRSVTAAQHALLMLRREGIRASLTAAPQMRRHGGCGYALLTNGANAYKTAQALRNADILYQIVYRTQDDLNFEEVVL